MRVLFTLLLLVWFASPAYAYSSGEAVRSKQTAASLVVDRASITAGQPFWIALRLELNDGWHTYWKNSGDSGIPTTLELTLPEGFKAGDIQWPTPERLVLSGIVNYGYSKEAWHFVEITPPASLTSPDYTIKATAAWLACADICIPEHAELSLELPVSSTPVEADSDFREKLTTVPSVWKGNATYSTTIDAFDLTIPEPHLGDALAFFPLQNGVISNEKPPVISRNSKGLTLHFVRGETPLKGDYQGVLQDITLGNAYAITATQGTDGVISPSPASKAVDSVNNITLGAALLLAFGGGLLLNLMPCVLPVLSLKALSLVRMKDHTRVHALRHGLAYTAGVVLSFVSFAIALILLQQAGAEIGWGFQLQSPAFVAGLSLLMLLVGLNLSGVFELPVLFGNTGHSVTAQPTALGSFTTGILAVMVATPCTAPLMAPAIGFALSEPPALLLSIFIMLGLGLAAPFLLLSAYPSFTRLLPKPGLWMLHLKQFLAFPMYGTSAWLAWVMTRQAGADALAVLLAAAVFAALLVWSAAIAHTRAKRLLMGAFLIALSYGALHLIAKLGTVETIHASAEHYSEEKLNALTSQGKPVFLYATADWCITCKVNETLVLGTDEIKEYFRRQGITMMEADWTHRNAAITQLLQAHGRAGVPMYLYYARHKAPVLLPQILTIQEVERVTQ